MLLNKLSGWEALFSKAAAFKSNHLSHLLNDAERQQKLMFSSLDHFVVDFSKQRLSVDVLADLMQLAREAKVEQKIDDLLSGKIVNQSENRAALHSVLRAPKSAEDVFHVQKSLSSMERVIERIHGGQWLGFSGKPIQDVINIGVGGSDLGPLMSSFALQEFAAAKSKGFNIHFASTIDGSQLAELLPRLNPETTLFCIVSKTFSTIDTLSNADTALAWLEATGAATAVLKKCHFLGISAAEEKMSQWGIPVANQLLFWDWVGGRYSLWSVVGFTIALRIGMDGFRSFLAGAHAVDKHLANTELENNIPVLMALMDVWNSNFLAINAHAILPYDGRLKYFPSYLTQLEMESNGKSVSVNNEAIDYHTCPILWGEIGANAQHAFYQLLHQGTEAVNSDFIVAVRRDDGNSAAEKKCFAEHYSLNIANCLAQSRVLALGNAALSDAEQAQLAAYQQYAGNQPSTTILMDQLTPYTLGSLIALYEQKVFISAVLWDINPFDQWGVELGKTIAKKVQPALTEALDDSLDCSSAALIKQIRQTLSRNPS